MAGNSSDGLADDFFEQILAVPSYASTGDLAGDSMALQLGYGGGDASGSDVVGAGGGSVGYASISSLAMPLGLNLGHGLLKSEDRCGSGKRFRDELVDVNISSTSTVREPMQLASLFPPLGQLHADTLRLPGQPLHQLHHQEYDSLVTCGLRTKDQGVYQPFHGQPTHFPVAAVPVPPAVRPRVRARRGQATDPHSIAERLRRERIAERMKALQELVPSANKTDRAAMLDEIVDYVKFLRLQVKVLSMSRVGGAGAVTQLVTDGPQSSIEGDVCGEEQVWEKWASGDTEQHVAKLMEEDVGAAMQFLQSKSLCIMPISLASTIFNPHHHHHIHHSDVKPETDTA